jgi:hypothetical protein
MKNKICLELLVFVLISSFFSTPAQAIYKKKVLVGKFQNPVQWDKPYDPGIIISELLNQELIHKKGIQLISLSEYIQKLMNNDNPSSDENFIEPTVFDSRESSAPEIKLIQNTGSELIKSSSKMMPAKNPMDDDPLWPAKLGKKVHKSTFIEVRGEVIKFMPDNRISNSNISLRSKNSENAEVAVNIELIQHNTGRVLHEKTFIKTSSVGTQPFSIKKINISGINERDVLSSMDSALNSLKTAVSKFVSEKIDYLPLEGEIISTKRKKNVGKSGIKINSIEEEILVNIGSSNGVSIGDLFQVYAVGLGLSDPYTGADLGDVYVKVGVIKILKTWEGTAKAMRLVGNNFEIGSLVRSANIPIRQEEEEKKPWWGFHVIGSVN